MRKSKKFLALLTALSISASAFAGLGVTALADDPAAAEETTAWTAPQYTADMAVHSNPNITVAEKDTSIGGESLSLKMLGSISGGIEDAEPGEYNGQPGGTATFTVKTETAGDYNIKVTCLGASNRRIDLVAGETLYAFPTDVEDEYASYWTVISDEGARAVFTYTFENVALAAGDNSVVLGTKVDQSWAPDLVGIDVEQVVPKGPGIVYKKGSGALDGTINITYDKDAEGTLITAKFYADGTLKSFTAEDVKLVDGTVSIEADFGGDAVTLMLWDGLDTMIPLLPSVKVEGNSEARPTPVVTDNPSETPAPTAEPTAEPKPTMDPSLVYYTLDFEDDSKTYLNSEEGTTTTPELWASQYYFAGLSIATDKDAAINKHMKYLNNQGKGTRCAYYILPEAAGTVDENKQAVAEFDFKFKNGGTNGNNQLALIGSSGAPIQNGDYEPSNKPAGTAAILKFTQPKDGDAQFMVNNDASKGDTLDTVTVKSEGYKNDTWAHAKIVMNFENQNSLVTVTSLDGSETYVPQQLVPFVTSAEKLTELFVAAARDSSYVCMDNVVIRKLDSGDVGATYYTVTFNVDGNEKKVGVKEGETLTELPDTTKTGYIFDGWQLNDGTEYLSNEDVLAMEITSDITLTAAYHLDSDYIEPMVALEFSDFPDGGLPTAGADENTAASNPITVKIVGEIGGSLAENPDPRVTDLSVKWEFKGFRHIVSKAQAGENPETADGGENKYCDSYAEVVYDDSKPQSVDFQLKNVPMNFYGEVKATVTYGGQTMEITKPMAIIPNKASDASTILPKPGYVENFEWYSDDLVGYQATTSSDNKSATDIVTGDWAAYGGNSGRGLYIAKDEETGKKFLKLKSTGTNSSSFAVNKLDSAPTGQVIIKQDMKFYNSGTSILFKTANPVTWTTGSATSLSLNFTGTDFNLNSGESICAASAGKWYTIVLSADVTSKLCSAKIYDKESGELLGSSEILPFSDAGSTAPVYLCYRTPDNSMGELDFNNVKMYVPSIDETKFTVTSADETLSVPKAGGEDVSTTLNASALSTEGYDMIGVADWEIDSSVSDTSGIVITPDASNSHMATLTVKAGAPAGELPINVTISGVTKQIKINLTSSQDSVQFTKSVSSISIPLEAGTSGEYEYAAKVVGPKSEEDDTPIDIEGKTVTLAVYDKNNTNELTTLPAGIAFDAASGKLTVTDKASATTLYIRATSTNRKDETITKAVKVTIHGLAFDFGTDADGAVVEGYTAVTPSTAYSETTGYGIEDGTPTAGGTASAEDADSDNLTGTFTFKAKVTPAKVYKVKINYKGSAAAEKVNADLSGIDLGTDQIQTADDGSLLISVIDDVLDLTFSGGYVSSIVIEKAAEKAANMKPHIYTVGDSTIANNGSWAYVMARDYASYSQLPDIASFSNNGRGGKNLSSYYTGGELMGRVLVNICPGDYVMIGDMGTNGMGSAFEASFNYYIDACEALGAKVILNSYSPHGANKGGGYESGYDAETQTFDSYRKDSYDNIVRAIYEERTTAGGAKYDENIVGFVDIGKMADAAFNAYVDAYAANGYESRDAAAQDIIKCFGDHNHYSNGTLACQLMIEGYGDGADAKGIVKSLYEIISADLAK